MKVIAGDSFFKSLKRVFSPYHNFMDYIRYDIPRGIKNIFIWLPTVWQDRSWDFHFLFMMLHKKLSLMEPAIRNGHCVDGDKRADDIKTCILLLDRIIKDEYHENVFYFHEKKWGPLKMGFKDAEKGMCEIVFSRPNAITDEQIELERKESSYLYKRVGQMQKQDVELLFKIMARKGLSWWD